VSKVFTNARFLKQFTGKKGKMKGLKDPRWARRLYSRRMKLHKRLASLNTRASPKGAIS
jgi:hypothetical protein